MQDEWEEMSEDEVDAPGAKQVLDFFMSSELKEEDLRAYHEMKAEIEALEGLLEEKRKHILKVCRGMDQAKAGKFAVFFTKVKGRETFDWKAWATGLCGKPSDADREKYTKTGEESTRMDVKRLG